MRGALTAVGIVAGILAVPWTLLLLFGASLQSSEGDGAPGAVGIATMAAAGLGCFIAAAVISRSRPVSRAIMLPATGGLLVAGSAWLETR